MRSIWTDRRAVKILSVHALHQILGPDQDPLRQHKLLSFASDKFQFKTSSRHRRVKKNSHNHVLGLSRDGDLYRQGALSLPLAVVEEQLHVLTSKA